MNYFTRTLSVAIWLVWGCISRVSAQVITPKPDPVIIKLDITGTHQVKVSDVATISGGASANVLPASFDCGDLGLQGVLVTTAPQNSTTVSFNHPAGLVFDGFGNLYVSELDGETIRKITPQGIVTTFAGSGTIGNANGQGIAASFDHPNGLTIDDAGNIYVADAGNHVIRKITPGGRVSTFAGSSVKGNSNGTLTTATFNEPVSLCFDGDGNLYVVDESNNNIRKISPVGVVTTFAGTGFPGKADGLGTQASFTLPYGITIDNAGNLFVTDIQNYAVRKITPLGSVSTIAGNGSQGNVDGTGLNSGFGTLYGITNDASGNLFVYSGSQVRRISQAGVVNTFAGRAAVGSALDGKDTLSRFNTLNSLVTDAAGNIYVVDTYNNEIRVIKPTSDVITIAGDGTAATRDGDIGDIATLGQREKQIQVTVVATLTALTKPADITINYNGCQSQLRSYTFTTDDHCQDLNSKTIHPKTYDVAITQIPAPGTTIPNNVPTLVTLIATDTFGGSDTVTFNVTAINGTVDKPTSLKVIASADPVCAGLPVTFTADVTNPPDIPVYQWTVNGGIVSNDATFTSSTLSQGDKVNLRLNAANSVCFVPVLSDAYKITIAPPPGLSFKNNPLIQPGGSVRLQPVTTGTIIKYAWSPATGLSSTNIEDPIANPLQTTTYTLAVTAASGCTIGKTITVYVNDVLNIPNTFSPNGDGYNDTWNIPLLAALTNSTIFIYDRYGERIYNSTGYSVPWDGTYHGKPLPTGTYYYIIKTAANKAPLSGPVTIIR